MGMGPTTFVPQNTLAPEIRPSERRDGRVPLGRSGNGQPASTKEAAGRTKGSPRKANKRAAGRKAS